LNERENNGEVKEAEAVKLVQRELSRARIGTYTPLFTCGCNDIIVVTYND